MKVATCQYKVKVLKTYQDFENHVRWHLEEAVSQGAELILFPEFFSVELLTLRDYDMKGADDVQEVLKQFAREYTQPLVETFQKLSKEYNIMLADGSHFMYDEKKDKYYNTGTLFLPNGERFSQSKIHPSYEMVYNKSVTSPGESIDVFESDSVKYGYSICYDGSFPEIGRIHQKMGADIILAPTCCLDEWGRERNILFSQARASENQVFVINSHLIGGMPFPTHLPYGFVFTGKSGIYGPIQPMIGTETGIIAQGTLNVESVITGELDIDYLHYIRENGHNRNLHDKRDSFYRQYI